MVFFWIINYGVVGSRGTEIRFEGILGLVMGPGFVVVRHIRHGYSSFGIRKYVY